MEANNKKCLYEALDKSLGIGYRRAAWEGALNGAFSAIEPWLVPTQVPATRVPCKQVGRSGCDGYRIVAHANGTFVGVCDEGNCTRRLFSEAELVRYEPNITLFRREVARLFGIAPDLSAPEHHTLHPVGELRLGKEVFGVKIVGGLDPGLVERMVQLLWQQTRQKQLLLILSETEPKDRLKGLIERCGWIDYTIEEQFDLLPRGLRWTEGAEERWEGFKSTHGDTAAAGRFPEQPGLQWPDLVIRFLDGHTVSVRGGGFQGRFSYAEMGMEDKRTKAPDAQWELLRRFAEEMGLFTWSSKSANDRNKKRKERLARSLKTFFDLPGEPFRYRKEDGGWEAVFNIYVS